MEASIMMIGQKIVVVGGTAGIGLAVSAPKFSTMAQSPSLLEF